MLTKVQSHLKWPIQRLNMINNGLIQRDDAILMYLNREAEGRNNFIAFHLLNTRKSYQILSDNNYMKLSHIYDV